ncbi:MAG: hypothetical protein ACRDS0_05215 [Pseudonocardiaceae bacterium]
MIAVTHRRDTIPITCCVDGQSHDIPDGNVTAGHDGHYQALCGHLVLAAALAAPVGRPCASCNAMVAAHRAAPNSSTGRHSRHRQPGLLSRLLHGYMTPCISRSAT